MIMNRVPVKVDAAGIVWLAGKPQACPPIFPCSSRGELVFAPADGGLLLGPWGPDPDHHLILSGRFAGQQEGRFRLALDGESGLQVDLPLEAATRVQLRPRQRLWLSVPLSALEYCR